ncbi:MAG: cytochrome c3 family protein [Nitrospirota bacterium]
MSLNRLASLILAVLLQSALFISPDARAAQEAPTTIRVLVPESLTSVPSDSASSEGERRDLLTVQNTTNKKISLIGIYDGGKPEMEIINNGRSRTTPVFHGRYFHSQIILSLGANDIEVRWKAPGAAAWNVKALSVFRSSKFEGGVSSSYPPYSFHRPENEELCQECHQMRLTNAEIEIGMEKSCLKCHASLISNLHVHGPVSVGVCTICHNPASTPNKYQVHEDDKVLCYSCHEDRKQVDEKMKLQHGPVGAGMCTVCHESHSSPFEFQLVKSKDEICTMCHQEDADKWMDNPSLHPPFRYGNCVGCHDPHSSNFKYNLKKDRRDICSLCHQIPVPGHLHEVGKVPQFKLPDDFPLTDDGETMCLTCHDPHGAKGKHLTRRSGCDGCHTNNF